MNKLIIIGNGFDLAHGLKTSYSDFMYALVSHAFSEANTIHGGVYEDEVFKVQRHRHNHYNGHLKYLPDYSYYLEKRVTADHSTNAFDWDVSDLLFRRVIDECSLAKWVNVEREYYEMLLDVAKAQNRNEKQQRALQLNKSMNLMKSKLKKYLAELGTPEMISAYMELFYGENIGDSGTPEFCILDYNYTNTSSLYSTLNGHEIPVIHIHGAIDDDDNPLIFGFGDYLDPSFGSIEQADVNALLANLKPIEYKMTNNLTNLKAFINRGPFEVRLFGQSCGLSDRITLNKIFNHCHCVTVKIYYYQNKSGENNYMELIPDVFRHFPNKDHFEDRVVSFNRGRRMPQFDD
jgi:hypothetical protein